MMTYGYNPKISRWSPFHGAVYAVVEAIAKVVAMGGITETQGCRCRNSLKDSAKIL